MQIPAHTPDAASVQGSAPLGKLLSTLQCDENHGHGDAARLTTVVCVVCGVWCVVCGDRAKLDQVFRSDAGEREITLSDFLLQVCPRKSMLLSGIARASTYSCVRLRTQIVFLWHASHMDTWIHGHMMQVACIIPAEMGAASCIRVHTLIANTYTHACTCTQVNRSYSMPSKPASGLKKEGSRNKMPSINKGGRP